MAINKQIQNAIQTIVNRAIEVAPFDKTRTGIIKEKNFDGTYKVLVDGIIYPKVPVLNSQVAKIGELVKIKFPCGNTSQMYISGITKTTVDKQDKLVSGDNIKTINNISILGSGNIDIEVPALLVESKKVSKSITHGTIGDITLDVSKTDYIPLGIVGLHATRSDAAETSTNMFYRDWWLDGTTAHFRMYNGATSTNMTMNVTFYILYQSN